MMALAEYVNEAFTHISIYTALNWVVNRWHPSFYFKKDIKEPLRIGIEMLPMGNKHIVAYRLIAVIHRFFKGRYILWAAFFNNLAKHLPVFGNMILSILLSIADTPVAGSGEYDVVFLKKFFQIREFVFMA